MFADKTKGISIKPTIGRQVAYETYDEEEMKAIKLKSFSALLDIF